MGRKHTAQSRKKIGLTRREQLRKIREEDPYRERGERPCVICKVVKHYDINNPSESDFSRRRYKLAGGGFIWVCDTRCRTCMTAQRKARIDALSEEEKQAVKQRRYAQIDRDRQARYQREWKRMKRLGEGLPLGPSWLKYRHEVEPPEEDGTMELVDAAPFVQWFESLNGDRPTPAQMGPTVSRAVRRVTNDGQKRISIQHVDFVCTLAGHPEVPKILYPDG